MMKRKPKVAKENNERWLLTYSDLITLLMIFFIILYAMSTTDKTKFQDLTGAMRQAFNNGLFQLITIGGSPGAPKTLAGNMGVTPSKNKGTNTKNATPTSKSKQQSQVQAELTKLTKELGMQIQQNLVHISASRDGIDITLSGSLLFFPGGTDLKPESNSTLLRIGQLTRNLPNKMRVEGHTDTQPTGNSVYDNWDLSVLRATSIVKFLQQSGGITGSRLEATGFGQYGATHTNVTPQGRAANRRADIIILYP